VGRVGGAILIIGTIFGYRKYQKRRGQRLLNEPDEENSLENQPRQNNENTTNQSRVNNEDSHITRRVSITSPDLPNLNNIRLHSPLSSDISGQRVPSAALSVTMLDHMQPKDKRNKTESMPAIELIKFD
jgi:hypothetical protein